MFSKFSVSGPTPSPKPPAVPTHMTRKAKFVDGVIQRCAHPLCETVFTPQWRTGPSGKPNYCNACGLKYRNDLNAEKSLVVNQISRVSIKSILNAPVGASNQVSSLPTHTPEEEKTRAAMQINKILN